ncbi:MAG: phosphodiesterase [Streptosporangiaceae bacterium]
MKPIVIAQISDLHVGATWAPFDPLARFMASVTAIRRLPDRPEAILVSGDIADHGSADEYAVVAAELGALGIPVHVAAGNHDDRAALREYFSLPGNGAEPIDYAVQVGPLKVLVLDSTVDGADRGDIEAGQLDWLETTLAAAPGRPTALLMHHPPARTGVPALDAIGLSVPARLELGRIVARHSQVRAILSGHFHRAIATRLGARAVLTAPSTYTQISVHPSVDELHAAADESSAFLVHRFLDGEVVSYVQSVMNA